MEKFSANLPLERKKYDKPLAKKVKQGIEGEGDIGVLVNEIPMSHRAVIATFARMTDKDIEQIKAAKGDKEVFKQKVKELWKEIAVHGVLRKDRKTGEPQLLNFSDLDGQTCIGLLELAKINVKDIKYVKPGEFMPGRINFDTGDRYGFIVEDQGKTVFLDHHGPHGANGISATEITYEALLSLGLLKKEEYLDKLVNFVTQSDNKTFPDAPKYYENSYRTLRGLYRFVKFPRLLKFFQDGKTATDLLSEDELKKYGFIYKGNKGQGINRSAEQKKIVEESFSRLFNLDKAGFIVPSQRYGHIVVDIGKNIPGGYDAVRAYGCETFIIWDDGNESFFISTDTDKKLPQFSQGIYVRNAMCVKPIGDGELLKITLGEILRILTDGELEPNGKLAQYLKEEEGEHQVAERNTAV